MHPNAAQSAQPVIETRLRSLSGCGESATAIILIINCTGKCQHMDPWMAIVRVRIGFRLHMHSDIDVTLCVLSSYFAAVHMSDAKHHEVCPQYIYTFSRPLLKLYCGLPTHIQVEITRTSSVAPVTYVLDWRNGMQGAGATRPAWRPNIWSKVKLSIGASL